MSRNRYNRHPPVATALSGKRHSCRFSSSEKRHSCRFPHLLSHRLKRQECRFPGGARRPAEPPRESRAVNSDGDGTPSLPPHPMVGPPFHRRPPPREGRAPSRPYGKPPSRRRFNHPPATTAFRKVRLVGTAFHRRPVGRGVPPSRPGVPPPSAPQPPVVARGACCPHNDVHSLQTVKSV